MAMETQVSEAEEFNRRLKAEKDEARAARARVDPSSPPIGPRQAEKVRRTFRPLGEHAFTIEDKKWLQVLVEDYQSRQKGNAAPPPIPYRCLGEVPDDLAPGRMRRCNRIVWASHTDERVKTGEVVSCPDPHHRGQLTPMEPIFDGSLEPPK